MEERLSRDIDRWRDKVELSLDGRQIFFLFFGSALALCLVFVLGVMVGQRLEARTRAEAAAAKADPLALLDQLDEAVEEGADKGALPSRKEELSGPGAGKAGKPALVAKGAEPPHEGKLAEGNKPPSKAETPKVETPKVETPRVETPRAETPKAETPKAEIPKPPKPELAPMPAMVPPAKPEPRVAPPPPPRQAETPKLAEAPKTPEKRADAAVSTDNAEKAAAAEKAEPSDKAAKDGKGKYTLQLSSFPEKAEAEAFARKFDGSGMKVSIASVSLPGKGTWWRVRAGVFGSEKAALDAKASIEKKHSVIAYVARMQ